MDREQHLPYRATGNVVVLDGDGSRWVREDATSPVSEAEIRDFAKSLRETDEEYLSLSIDLFERWVLEARAERDALWDEIESLTRCDAF